MLEVNFYEHVADELLKFAVIISKTNGKFVFCKHKERDTYEVFQADIEKQAKLFLKQQKENSWKKQERLSLISSQSACIL